MANRNSHNIKMEKCLEMFVLDFVKGENRKAFEDVEEFNQVGSFLGWVHLYID